MLRLPHLALLLTLPACDASVQHAHSDASAQGDIDAGGVVPDAPAPFVERVYYVGDFDVADEMRLGVWDGESQDRSMFEPSDTGGTHEMLSVAVSPDRQSVAVAASPGPFMPMALHLLPALPGAPSFPLYQGTGDTEQMLDLQFSPDGTMLAYRANSGSPDDLGLYVVPIDGSSPPRRVLPVEPVDGSFVWDYQWVPGTSTLVARADLPAEDIATLWLVDAVDGDEPLELVDRALLQPGGDVRSGYAVLQDRVIFRSSYDSPGVHRLYEVSLDGGDPQWLAHTAQLRDDESEASVDTFAIQENRLAFVADSPTATLQQVFLTRLEDGSPAYQASSVTDTPIEGAARTEVRDIVWSPQGDRLAVIAEWPTPELNQNNAYSLYLLPTDGSTGDLRLIAPPDQDTEGAFEVDFTATGDSLIVRGDYLQPGPYRAGLYRITSFVDADQDPEALLLQDAPEEARGVRSFVPAP